MLDTRPGCALFLGARVDWVWTSQVLGFDPVFIHFRQENPLVALIQRLIPRATVVVGSHALLPTRDLPGVAFVDGHAGSFEFLFKKQDVIISTKGRRGKLPEGWHMHKARTTHAAVGGVTNSVDHCFLFSRGAGTPSQNEVTVPRALPRDVHSVISDTIAGPGHAPLEPSRLVRPEVFEILPGLYHGGGLLPVDHPRGQFVVRSVFTPTKWCRRRLTPSELATAFDVPHEIIQQCSHQELLSLTVHPSRGLEHCARSTMAHAEIIDRGGGIYLEKKRRARRQDLPAKRRRHALQVRRRRGHLKPTATPTSCHLSRTRESGRR